MTPDVESTAMPTYLPDTNVLIDYGRDQAVEAKLEGAEQAGSKFVLAPSMMTELTVGVVKGGAKYFAQNKKIFAWLQAHSGNILELPLPFIGKTMGGVTLKRSHVETQHYVQRIEMVVNSPTFDEFLKSKDGAGNVWSDIDQAVQIHHSQVDKEFTALESLAKLPKGKIDVATRFCKTYSTAVFHPDPKLFKQYFSAAVEYAEVSIAKIRSGANPRKNDRGRYGDFQLFFDRAA